MSKSKRRNHKQQPAFFEALPIPAAPPIGLPLVAIEVQLTQQALAEVGRGLLRKIRPLIDRSRVNILQAGFATSETLIHALQTGLLAARMD